MININALELASWLADATRTPPLLLDVREPWEYEICHLNNSVAIPLKTLPVQLEEFSTNIAPETTIVCICHHGVRSLKAAHFLQQNGFSQPINLTGGINAWAQQVDPTMAVY